MQKVRILKREDREKLLGKISSEQNEKSVAPRCPGPCPLNPCRIMYKQYTRNVR